MDNMNNQPVCEIDEDGDVYWTLNGQDHRDDGPAIEFSNGSKQWWVHGKLHRLDGPAIESISGTKEWWLNGKRHREDGPAFDDGEGYKAWFLFGEEVEPEEVVDYNLAKGIFCYYDDQEQELKFGEKQ